MVDHHNRRCGAWLLIAGIILASCLPALAADAGRFEGKHYRGRGDVQYLQLLDIARQNVCARPGIPEPVDALHADLERLCGRPHLECLVDSKQLRHHLLRAAIFSRALPYISTELTRPVV